MPALLGNNIVIHQVFISTGMSHESNFRHLASEWTLKSYTNAMLGRIKARIESISRQ